MTELDLLSYELYKINSNNIIGYDDPFFDISEFIKLHKIYPNNIFYNRAKIELRKRKIIKLHDQSYL